MRNPSDSSWREGLPDRGPADSEGLGELRLGDPLAGPQEAADDRFPEGLGDPLAERPGFARDILTRGDGRRKPTFFMPWIVYRKPAGARR